MAVAGAEVPLRGIMMISNKPTHCCCMRIDTLKLYVNDLCLTIPGSALQGDDNTHEWNTHKVCSH
jgi:hypothetical protein